MKIWQPTLLALSLLAAFPALAQSNGDLQKELQALKQKTTELEQRLQALDAQSGEQKQELSRVAVKAEALEDGRDAMGFKLFKISGYMDPSFISSRARNTAGFQFLNGVGDDGYAFDNSSFGVLALDLLKETDSGTKFHVTLIPSRGSESIATGANRLLQEASVAVPLGDPTTLLLAGMLPDWSGYEMVQPMPSAAGTGNKLITHNLLYDFTLPASYTGAGVQFTVEGWTVKTLLANMNASKRTAGNKTPVFAYRADYAISEYAGVGFAGVIGKAANFRATETDTTTGTLLYPDDQGKDTAVHLFEVDGFYTRGDLTLQGQLSIGSQKKAAITAASGQLRDASWRGASALAAYKFTPRVEGSVRLDYLNNRKNGGGLLGYTGDTSDLQNNPNRTDRHNGIGPDPQGDPEVGANRSALAFGGSYQLDASTLLKVEYRIDRATLPVFQYAEDGVYRKTNQLFGAAVVVSF
ncbi:MAG: DUF3138 family protein [Leptothrix sp. (in: b-proteobacteria)]